MNHFEFLEKIKVGDEVLFTTTGDTIHKVTGVNDKFITAGWGIFERETGFKFSKRKDDQDICIQYLSSEKKKEIEQAKEDKKTKEKQDEIRYKIIDDYEWVTGNNYRSQRPSVPIMKKVIALIKKEQAKEIEKTEE